MSRADIVAVGSSSLRRCTDNLRQLHGSSPLQYVHSQASAHHVTATNGLEFLRSCSLSDVTVEGSSHNMAGRSRMGSFVLVSTKPTVADIVCNSAAQTTASAQPALCAETHSSRKRTRRGMKTAQLRPWA